MLAYTEAVSQFQIFTSAEIASLRRAGKILAECLRHIASNVVPGIKTIELDRLAEKFIRSHDGARPAFKGYRNYPSTLCTSVNEECVHGLPGERVLKAGDIVALDSGVIVDHLYTDACITVGVGTIEPAVQNFLKVTEETLKQACVRIAPGVCVGDLSSLIQKNVEVHGYHCVQALTGHGLGKTLHQFPDIPNVGQKGTGPVLPAWTLIAIEPITSMGEGQIREADDGWTILTRDGSLSAHFEHTVLTTENGHEIIA